MPRLDGLAWTAFAIDDSAGTARELKSEIVSLEYEVTTENEDVTTIDQLAMARNNLLTDFKASITGHVNDDANSTHDVFKDYHTGIRTVTITQGTFTIAAECILTSYKISRGTDGGLRFESEALLADGAVPVFT